MSLAQNTSLPVGTIPSSADVFSMVKKRGGTGSLFYVHPDRLGHIARFFSPDNFMQMKIVTPC